MTYYKYDFFKYVAPHVRGIPEPTVEDTVENIIIDFCQRSGFYRQWLSTQISVAIDDEDVSFTPPANTAIVNVLGVQKVEASGDYGVFIDPETYLFSNQDGTPQLLFNDPADEAYTARVRVSLRPVIGFSVVPDWVYEDWRYVITAGVVQSLLSMRSKPWYARVESEKHRAQYEHGIARASREVVLETINKISRPVSRYI